MHNYQLPLSYQLKIVSKFKRLHGDTISTSSSEHGVPDWAFVWAPKQSEVLLAINENKRTENASGEYN